VAIRTSLAVLVLALAALVPGAAAAAVPTTVTVLRGTIDSGPTQILVATERLGPRRVRITALRSDSVADDERYPLYLATSCSSSAKRRAKLELPNARAVTSTRRLAGGAAFSAPAVRAKGRGACVRIGPRATGGVLAPRDAASGLPTGLVALQRRGPQVRVTSLITEVGFPKLELAASTRPCGEPVAAADLQWATGVSAGALAVARLGPWRVARTRSLAVLPDGTADPRVPRACVKWELSELDA
jgi:hypothetical protein